MWQCRCKFFPFVRWPHNQKVMWLLRWGSPTVSYHSVNFVGHRYCERADIRLYICHVTMWSKDQVTWWMLLPHYVTTLFKEDVIFPIPLPVSISMFTSYQRSAWTMCMNSNSPAPFINSYKIKTRFQFSRLYFVDHIFNDYLVE